MHSGMWGPLSPVRFHASQAVWTALLLDAHTCTVDGLKGEVPLHAPGHLVDLEAQSLAAG